MIAERAAWILIAIERELLTAQEKDRLEAIEAAFQLDNWNIPAPTENWLEHIFEAALWRGWGEGVPGE